MTEKEWQDTLVELDQDFQLTPYRKKIYKGKNGSIWYVAELNALCLIPSNVRQDDEMNQLGLHTYELNHVCDKNNVIIRGFAAIYARIFSNKEFWETIDCIDMDHLDLIIRRRLERADYDKRETITNWQETLNREKDKRLWKLLNINFDDLRQYYGHYLRHNFKTDKPVFDPGFKRGNYHRIIWLTDGEDYIDRLDNIRIQQVLEYDTWTFNYGLHKEICKKGSSYASQFMQELLNYSCQWAIYLIDIEYCTAWDYLETMDETELLIATIHRAVVWNNPKLVHSFRCFVPTEIYNTYLSHAYTKCRDDLGKLPATAKYVDDENYIWHEIYEEEKEAFEKNRLNEILPPSLYEKLEEYTIELLNYIRYKYFGDEPENERAPKTKHQAVPQWQQILKDLAVPDEYCKQSYGAHNVRIAMYLKALEDCKLLTVVDRQGANSLKFYTTLSEIFQYTIHQNSVEWQINHLLENKKNKHTYENEILPLVKDSIKPQK